MLWGGVLWCCITQEGDLFNRLATLVRALAASHRPLWKRACGARFTSQRWFFSEIKISFFHGGTLTLTCPFKRMSCGDGSQGRGHNGRIYNLNTFTFIYSNAVRSVSWTWHVRSTETVVIGLIVHETVSSGQSQCFRSVLLCQTCHYSRSSSVWNCLVIPKSKTVLCEQAFQLLELLLELFPIDILGITQGHKRRYVTNYDYNCLLHLLFQYTKFG